MNKFSYAIASALILVTGSLAACSSDEGEGDSSSSSSSSSTSGNTTSSSGGSTTSSSGGSTSSSGGSTTSSSSSSSGASVLNDCTSFVDHTASTADVEIEWVNPVSDPDRCSKIKVGTKVVWKGNFRAHPLNSQGGTTPTPITLFDDQAASSHEVEFTSAGDFGYVCTAHSIMQGVIQVVE